MFSRTKELIGTSAMDKLKNSKVAVFGVGGVGSFAVEALARSGIHNIVLIDNDVVSASNINRQLQATTKTIGRYKVEVMKERILEINPSLNVTALKLFYDSNTDKITWCFDYVIDAIDTITSKINLIITAKKHKIPIISSMGAGNKLDPTKFQVADIYKTSVCPLAKVMRKELKSLGVDNLKVVYSTEMPVKKNKPPASISFVPSVAGLIIAGEAIKDLIKD